MEFMRENFHGAQLKVRRTNSGHESKHLNCIADCTVTSFGEVSFIGVYIPLPLLHTQEAHHNVLVYQWVPHPQGLGRLHRLLDQAREQLGLEEFSVSRTTLDDVG